MSEVYEAFINESDGTFIPVADRIPVMRVDIVKGKSTGLDVAVDPALFKSPKIMTAVLKDMRKILDKIEKHLHEGMHNETEKHD